MPLPEKAYDRLSSLWKRWDVSQEDVYYSIENGLLRVCVWLPLRYLERGVIKDGKFIYEQHEPREGFVGVRPEDFHRICSTGCAKLRIFRSVREEEHILRMAYEPPQPAISVRLNDLVVLQQDRIKFEKSYQLQPVSIQHQQAACALNREFSASPDYHHISIHGEEFHLGDVQARVVEQLHDALQSRTQWVHGKTLIYGANSKAVRLRDIFKSKRDWSKIIASNGRGYYRLNIEPHQVESKKHRSVASITAGIFLGIQEMLDFSTECIPLLCPI
jgi:hypothetical protein